MSMNAIAVTSRNAAKTASIINPDGSIASAKVLLIAPHSIDGYYWMIYAMFQLDHPEMARGELRMAQRNLLEEEYDELIERLKVAGFSRCYGITPA